VRGRRLQEFAYLTPDHFQNDPICGHEAKADYCDDGKCVTEETKRAIAVVRDPRSSKQERLLALEEVVHFVGDLHQPLHVADNDDRGGNLVPVGFEGEATNLHAIWDTGLVVQAVGRSEADAEAHLRPIVLANGTKWANGSVDDWAAEAHEVAVTVVYGKLATPPACGHHPAPQTISAAYEAMIPLKACLDAPAGRTAAGRRGAGKGRGAP
jgi:hypothetical protein